MVKRWNRLLRELSLRCRYPWRYWKPFIWSPEGPVLTDPDMSSGVRLEDAQRSVPISALLWFHANLRCSVTQKFYNMVNAPKHNPEGYARMQLLYTTTRIPLPAYREGPQFVARHPVIQEEWPVKMLSKFKYSANHFGWNSSKMNLTKSNHIRNCYNLVWTSASEVCMFFFFADSNYVGIKIDHSFCKTSQTEKYFKKPKYFSSNHL